MHHVLGSGNAPAVKNSKHTTVFEIDILLEPESNTFVRLRACNNNADKGREPPFFIPTIASPKQQVYVKYCPRLRF